MCIWLCSYAGDTEKENHTPQIPILLHSALSFWFHGHSKMMPSALIVLLFVNSNAIGHHVLYFPECFRPRYVGRNVLKTVRALQMYKNFMFSKLTNWPRIKMSDGIFITLNFHYFPILILIKTPKGSPKQSLSHHVSQCLGDSSQVRKWGLGWIAHSMQHSCGRVS